MKINPQSRRRTESFPSLCNLVQLCTFLAQVLNHVLNFTASVLNTHAHGPSSGESPTHKQGSMWNPFKLTSYLQCLWDFCCQVKNAPVEAQHFCQEKLYLFRLMLGFQVGPMVKNLPAVRETWVQSLGQKNPLGRSMAIHSSILSWRVPQTEELGGLQSMGSQRVNMTE